MRKPLTEKQKARARAYHRRWRAANRERVRANHREWVAAHREEQSAYFKTYNAAPARRKKTIIAVKKWKAARLAKINALKVKCLDCSTPERLEFHHRDPATKLFSVGDGSRSAGAASWAVILAEIAKCDVLCESCHKRRHRAERRAA